MKFTGCIYSPSGYGKTLSLAIGIPGALVVGPAGGDDCTSYLGVTMSHAVVVPDPKRSAIDDTIEVLEKHGKTVKAIIVDDISVMFNWECDVQLSTRMKGNKFALYDKFAEKVYKLVNIAEQIDAHVMFTAHEQDPKTIETPKGEKNIPGCPLVPGWKMPPAFPALFRFIARMVHHPLRGVAWPYSYCTSAAATPGYVAKDRYNITTPWSPPNMGEVLRAAECALPPHPLPWFDAAVEALAQRLMPALADPAADIRAAVDAAQAALGEKVKNPKHIRWAVICALSRAHLRIAAANVMTDYVSGLAETSG